MITANIGQATDTFGRKSSVQSLEDLNDPATATEPLTSQTSERKKPRSSPTNADIGDKLEGAFDKISGAMSLMAQAVSDRNEGLNNSSVQTMLSQQQEM